MRDSWSPIQVELGLCLTKFLPSTEIVELASQPVLDVVTAHVSSITRFERSDLTSQGAERQFHIPVGHVIFQQVTYARESHDGAGRLPNDVAPLADAAALDSLMNRSMDRTQLESRDAIEAWNAQDAGSYRRLMPASAAFKKTPSKFGYEHGCGTCGGATCLTCRSCAGHGRHVCSACSAHGTVTCPMCHGHQTMACTSCGGSATQSKTVYDSVWDSYSQTNRTVARTVTTSCYACAGGRIRCTGCSGGYVTCGRCAGGGYTRCDSCQGAGQIQCSDCAATGMRHHWSIIAASVQVSESPLVTTDTEPLKSLLQKKIGASDLPSLGQLVQVEHDFVSEDPPHLKSSYLFALDVVHASVVAAGRSFEFFGFGPERKVFDYLNISAHLLEDDLAALEACIGIGSKAPASRDADLLPSLRRFVESELNLGLTEALLAARRGPKNGPAPTANPYLGVVDDGYITRSHQALTAALNSIFVERFRAKGLMLAGVTVLAVPLMLALKWPTQSFLEALLFSVVPALLLWMGLEQHVHSAIAHEFPEPVRPRIKDTVKASKAIRQLRLWTWGASSLLLVGGGWAAGYISRLSG